MSGCHKKIVLISFLLLLSVSVFSIPRGAQELIPEGHWVYDAINQLEIDIGRYDFVDVAPLSIQQVRFFLENDIIYEKLSDTGKLQYDRILSYFQEDKWSFNSGLFSLGTEISVNPEAYVKTSDDLEWKYDYHERLPFIDLPITLNAGDYASVNMGLAVIQNRTAMLKNDNYTNQAFTPDTFDPYLAHTTYLSTGCSLGETSGFSFKLGTLPQNYGKTKLGSIAHSDYLKDCMAGILSFYSPVFGYEMNITQLNKNTYLYTHRLDFRFFKKFTASFMEGVAPYSGFDLRFINPLGIFHGMALFNEYDAISYFAMRFNWVPVRNLRLYFVYSQDEHQLASEKKSGQDYVPEALGFQGGFELQVPAGSGYFKLGLEGYYASPYLYIKESPNWSLVHTRREMVSGTTDVYEWIGSPLGPDSVAGIFNIGYEKPGKWSLDFNYLFGARGEFSSTKIFSATGWTADGYGANLDNWIYPTATNKYKNGEGYKAPHGNTEYVNSVFICGLWSPNKWFSLKAQPCYTFIFNQGHEDGKYVHGFELALSTRFFLTKISNNISECKALFQDRYDREAEENLPENK